jgi:hypothetical protein
METILTGVAVALIVAAILGLRKWLLEPDNRQKLKQWTCRHDWRPIETGGDGIIFVTEDSHECAKCEARRQQPEGAEPRSLYDWP